MVVFSSKFDKNLYQAPLCQNHLCQIGIQELNEPLQQKHTIQLISERVLLVCCYDDPFKIRIFQVKHVKAWFISMKTPRKEKTRRSKATLVLLW